MWTADEAWRAPVGDFPPLWASAWGDDHYGLWADLTVNGVTQRMRWIEPSGPEGFLMGLSQKQRDEIEDDDVREAVALFDGDVRTVLIEFGFWLADTPCTQAFWQAVVGKNPSEFKDEPDSALRPVDRVNWDDVEKFILHFAATPEWICEDRLGLPTEAQWEYAARAGSTTAYWWGDEADSTLANLGREQGGTTPVKRYPANPWGLFDVHGNVWEWCEDEWTLRLDASDARPDADGRVVRGGSWFDHPDFARSAFRAGGHRGSRINDQGFRFALRSSGPGAEQQQGIGPGGPAR